MMSHFYKAKVVKVVDGDTVDLLIDLGFSIMHKVRVRLHGVNTPESRTRDLEEKALGLAAKDYVSDWLLKYDQVYVKTIKDKSGKYGRILGYIYSDYELQACLNDDIIDSGHGVVYDGGAR
jgi:micrococcal nuclease